MNVIMLHSIGNHNAKWCRNWLSASFEHFEEFCKYLSRKGYETLHLSDWYRLQDYPKQINNKQVVLTFDDGYLDNWVYAYPLLKKYKLKGTIFVNPEFVDPSEKVRPTMEDVWTNRTTTSKLDSLGFLNWEEIKTLDSSGVMDIQSHSMSHNFYFYTDRVIDYYVGQDDYHWLAWVKRPDRKPFWITEDQTGFSPQGYPIFEYGRALGLRRFIPSDAFVSAYSAKAQQLVGEQSPDIKERLRKFTEDYKNDRRELGRFETDEEMEERYRYELFESKRILGEKLKKEIDFLCWPGGGYSELSVKLSKEAGYKASTINFIDGQKPFDNSQYYKRIFRFGMGSFVITQGDRNFETYKYIMINRFKLQQGKLAAKLIRKLIRAKHLVAYYLRSK